MSLASDFKAAALDEFHIPLNNDSPMKKRPRPQPPNIKLAHKLHKKKLKATFKKNKMSATFLLGPPDNAAPLSDLQF